MQYTIEESKTFNNIFTIYDECYYCEKNRYLAVFIDRDNDGLELCEKCTEFLDMTDYIYINNSYSQADEDNM